MKIRISIQYHTAWGEQVVLATPKKVFPMEFTNGGLWQAVLPGTALKDGDRYGFRIVRGSDTVRSEWRRHRFTAPATAPKDLLILRERWIDRPENSAFWSSAFTDVIFRRERQSSRPDEGNLTLRIPAAEVRPGEAVGLVGSGKALGDWKKVHFFCDAEFPWWTLTLNVKQPFSYKLVIADRKTGAIRLWENGADHFFAEVPGAGIHVVEANQAPVFPTVPWRGAGVAVPVFSLRTEDGFGVGEFADIKKLVDWAEKTGQNVIQLLPVNDTTMTHKWQDSYPYNAVSSFALHPQFLNLQEIGVKADAKFKARRAELNALPKIDYEAVNDEKLAYARKAFEKTADLDTPAFKAFVEEDKIWLLPYAAFCVLRDQHGTADFSQWGAMAKYNARKVNEFIAANRKEVDFYCWLQFRLDRQLKDAVAYAHQHNVALKGDLPIGVSRTSADAWTFPELFHMDSQAGAPPDAFSVNGQNWGFPTYNWEEMAKDGYGWWKARLRKMSEYFDAFRIDHILGFFRIWEIPLGIKSGLLGHFNPALPYSGEELRGRGFDPESDLFVPDPHRPGWYHPRISSQKTGAFEALDEWHKNAYNDLYNDFFYRRHNAFWKETAMRKLPALLDSTGMLACGEDLGMIPACVPEVMDELKILSLEVQRMPKSPEDTFGNPATYPYLSVCTTGSHDTSSLRAWWEEDRELTSRYFHEMLHLEGLAPSVCEPWICERIIKQHLESPSMLCILPLQDWLSIDGTVRYQGNPADERINVPANPRHYWRWRMHTTLEDLLSRTAFNDRLRELSSTR